MGSTTWQFNQAIQPGKSWTVRFDATPKRSGTIRGVIEVQVNVAPKGVPFTVEVKPAAGATPAQPGSGNRDGGT